MKTVLNILFGIMAIGIQPILYETSDWGINYLNAHPTTIKIVPLLIGLGCSLLFTMTISPISNMLKPPFVAEPGKSTSTINPFWGWFAMCLVINVVWNMMLE